MKLKSITKAKNRKTIMIYYSLALIFVSIGLFLKDSRWYILASAFLFIAMFRKYWLHKKLKE